LSLSLGTRDGWCPHPRHRRALRQEAANFKRFNKLIELALKASQMRVWESAKTHHTTPWDPGTLK
jgi:hypothetical protein